MQLSLFLSETCLPRKNSGIHEVKIKIYKFLIGYPRSFVKYLTSSSKINDVERSQLKRRYSVVLHFFY